MIQQGQRLYRCRGDRLLLGVAGGQAEYLDVDPVLVRLGWVLLILATAGIAVLAYIVLAVITPKNAQLVTEEAGTVNDSSTETADSAVATDQTNGPSKRHTVRNVFGVGLIVVGSILLLQNLGVFGSIRWDIVWPVAVVALGVTVLLPSIRRWND